MGRAQRERVGMSEDPAVLTIYLAQDGAGDFSIRSSGSLCRLFAFGAGLSGHPEKRIPDKRRIGQRLVRKVRLDLEQRLPACKQNRKSSR
jgi:hypothetical protein